MRKSRALTPEALKLARTLPPERIEREAELVAGVEKWIVYQATRYARMFGAQTEELAQAGRVCAARCARSYDPSKGAKFLTYCARAILQEMRREGRWLQDPVHVPVHIQQERRIYRVELDAPVSADDPNGTTVGDLFGEGASPERAVSDSADATGRAEHLHEALERMPERLRSVLMERFFQQRTLQEIGDDWGVCRERIRQIEADALQWLRNWGGLGILK